MLARLKCAVVSFGDAAGVTPMRTFGGRVWRILKGHRAKCGDPDELTSDCRLDELVKPTLDATCQWSHVRVSACEISVGYSPATRRGYASSPEPSGTPPQGGLQEGRHVRDRLANAYPRKDNRIAAKHFVPFIDQTTSSKIAEKSDRFPHSSAARTEQRALSTDTIS